MKYNTIINWIFAVWLMSLTLIQLSVYAASDELFKEIIEVQGKIVDRITGKTTAEKEQYGPPYGKMIIENEPAFDAVYGPDDLVKSMRDHDKK